MISGVPITFDFSSTQIEQYGLDIIKINPANVNIKIKGPRYKVASFKKDDFVVAPVSLRNITSDGDYEVELRADFKQAQHDVKIEGVSIQSAIFSVDVLKTKLVDLTCNLPNVRAAEGYVLDAAVCQPKSLYVSGPKKVVDCLNTIRLDVNSGPVELNSTKNFDVETKFVAVDGSVFDESQAKLLKFNNSTKLGVIVPVYRQKMVPLTWKIKNAPACLDLSLIRAKVQPSQISLGVSKEAADSIKEINLGYVDMRDFDLKSATDSGLSFTFPIDLPTGAKNLNDVKTARVVVDCSDWVSKSFSVSDVQLINDSNENFEVHVESSVLKDVKIVGINNNFLEAINKSNITATIDLAEVNLKPGKQTVPVTIGILNKNGVWPVGNYTCCINIKKIKKRESSSG